MSTLTVHPLPFKLLGPTNKAWLDAFDPGSSLHEFLPVGSLDSISPHGTQWEIWRDASARRKELAGAFESLDLPYSTAQAQAIQDLRNPKSLVAVTGQQPGALGGPLYTFNKILSTVVFSQRLRDKWNVPVIPVLWDGGDDHDLAEVDEVAWPKGDEGVSRFHFGISEEGARPAWMVQVSTQMRADWEEFLDELHPATEYRRHFSDWFSPLWNESHGWCDLFDRFWLRIFENHPLLIVRPWESSFRGMAGGILTSEVENPEASMEAVAETTTQISQAGYKSQVHKRMGVCNFFYLSGGRRRPVTYTEGLFRIEGYETPVPMAQLLDESQTHPERFSPNALMRPVVQDAILPSAAVVLGPAEIAYHAQLKGLYTRHSVARPWIIPRLSMTFTTSSQMTRMEELGLSWDDLKKDETELTKHLAATGNEDPALVNLRSLDEHLHQTREMVLDQLRIQRRHLAEPIQSQLGRVEKILGQVQDLLLRDEAKRDSTRLGRIRSLKLNLWPEGSLQERVYGLPLLLCRHGFDWIESLIENVHSLNGESHYIITLGK